MIHPYVIPGVNSTLTTAEKIRVIMAVVSCLTDVERKVIEGKNRSDESVFARQVYCVMCRKFTDASLKQVGLTINRDHTTVMHSIRHVKDLCETDHDYLYSVKAIEKKIFSRLMRPELLNEEI